MLPVKVKVVLSSVLALLLFAVAGAAYQPGSGPVGGKDKGRPLTELEALRRENELLKLNLEVVLEKVRAQEAELRKLRGPTAEDLQRLRDLDRIRRLDAVPDKKAVPNADPSGKAKAAPRVTDQLADYYRSLNETSRRLAEEAASKQKYAAELAAAQAALAGAEKRLADEAVRKEQYAAELDAARAALVQAQEQMRIAEEAARQKEKRARSTGSVEQEIQKAVKVLQEAKSREEKVRAIRELENLLLKLKEREGGPQKN
jgi:hypothetical protein